MAKRMQYEVAQFDGNADRLKERLQRFADQGFRYVGSIEGVVIMERKAKKQDEDDEEEEE